MLTLDLTHRIDLDGIPQTEGFDDYRFGGLFSGFGAGNGMGGIVALDDRFVFSTMYNDSLTGAYINGWTALSGAGQQLLPWMELDPDFELFIQNVFWDPAQQTYNVHINNRNTAKTDIVEYDLFGDQGSVTSLQEIVVERLIPDPKSDPQPRDETDVPTNFISFGGFHDTATTSTGDFITMSALFNTGVKVVMPVLYNAQGSPIGAGTLFELEDDYISGFSQAPLDIHRVEASGGVVHLIYSGRGSSNLYHLTMDEAGNNLGAT